MSTAIYFEPEGYSTSGPKLMGRNAAGESFLRGHAKFSTQESFLAVTRSKEAARPFIKAVRSQQPDASIRIIDQALLGQKDPPDTIFYPGPGLSPHSFQRSKFGNGCWSLCGIAHTTSSDLAMDALVGLLNSPVQPWDAVICPSKAVKANIENVLNAQMGFLRDSLGASQFTLPQLPVIPLGIHAQDFVHTPEDRSNARVRLGVADDEVVVGYMGRLSFHAKAHPVSMYRSLELAAERTKKKIVVLECGWHGNELIKRAFEEAQSVISPSIRYIYLDGRESKNRDIMWASTDIFCSFSDNIQETFGITPLEAMAAGIPVVVSDWDGYKESVEDGEQGFKVPTVSAESGHGEEFARNFGLSLETYDRYCGNTCMFVAVDVQHATEKFISLINSEELRQELGLKGKKRAESVYDWRVIIPQYEELWSELSLIRKKEAKIESEKTISWPARLDPFSSFAHYSSDVLTSDTLLSLVEDNLESSMHRIRSYKSLKVFDFAAKVLPSEEEFNTLLLQLEGQDRKASEVVENIEPTRKEFCMRALNWLLKTDVIRIVK